MDTYLNDAFLPLLWTFTGCLQYAGYLYITELPSILQPFNNLAHLQTTIHILSMVHQVLRSTNDATVTSIGKYIGLELLYCQTAGRAKQCIAASA